MLDNVVKVASLDNNARTWIWIWLLKVSFPTNMTYIPFIACRLSTFYLRLLVQRCRPSSLDGAPSRVSHGKLPESRGSRETPLSNPWRCLPANVRQAPKLSLEKRWCATWPWLEVVNSLRDILAFTCKITRDWVLQIDRNISNKTTITFSIL